MCARERGHLCRSSHTSKEHGARVGKQLHFSVQQMVQPLRPIDVGRFIIEVIQPGILKGGGEGERKGNGGWGKQGARNPSQIALFPHQGGLEFSVPAHSMSTGEMDKKNGDTLAKKKTSNLGK